MQRVIKILLICGTFLIFSTDLKAGIILKTIATNPSSTKTQTITVKSYLPKGIEPENVIDKGEFEIGYDLEKSLYYVYQDVTLVPKESIILEIEIEDIWIIPEDKLDFLRGYSRELLESFKKTKYYPSAKLLADSIEERLDEIIKRQTEPVISVEEHISKYEDNINLLKEVKRDIGVLEDLVIETGGILPGEELIGEISLEKTFLREEKMDFDIEKLGTLKLNITISNPSSTETQVLPLKYYLPEEFTPDYLIDSGGLDIGYDVRRRLHYAYKDEVKLAPLQSQRFIIELKDVWFIPEDYIKSLKTRAKRLAGILEGSRYYKTANFLVGDIMKGLDEIIRNQSLEDLTPEEHIGNYRSNMKRLNGIKGKLARLEKLVVQAGGIPGLSALKETKQKEGEDRGIMQRVKLAGRSIFRGKVPSVSESWRLIYIVICFLAIISLLFFILQLMQHRQLITDNLTGIYTRRYIIGRFQQELQRKKAKKLNYAFLMIDIDGFKDINDKHGHSAGDSVLREIAFVIKRNLRAIDILSRFGGDEFFVVLPGRTKEEASAIGKRLTEAVATHRIKPHFAQPEALAVTISVGISAFPEDEIDFEKLLHEADKALYQAKRRGGNCVSVCGAKDV